MRLFDKLKIKNIYQRLLWYLAEVVIIFLGITFSFFFERWREEKAQKKELIELSQSLIRDAEITKAQLKSDLEGTELWISQLDSIRIQRDFDNLKEQQLLWFYELLSGKQFGLFDPKSPTYLSAISTGQIDKLPDSIQSQVYRIYQMKLGDFKFLYDQQNETIRHFRDEIMIPSDSYPYEKGTSIISLNYKTFAKEVNRPVYGNFINQIISAEKAVYKANVNGTNALDKLIENLQKYRENLQK